MPDALALALAALILHHKRAPSPLALAAIRAVLAVIDATRAGAA